MVFGDVWTFLSLLFGIICIMKTMDSLTCTVLHYTMGHL